MKQTILHKGKAIAQGNVVSDSCNILTMENVDFLNPELQKYDGCMAYFHSDETITVFLRWHKKDFAHNEIKQEEYFYCIKKPINEFLVIQTVDKEVSSF